MCEIAKSQNNQEHFFDFGNNNKRKKRFRKQDKSYHKHLIFNRSHQTRP